MFVVYIVVKYVGRFLASIAKEIEWDLCIFLFCYYDKVVIYYVCKMLCVVVEICGGKDSGMMFMLKWFVVIVIEFIFSDEALSV